MADLDIELATPNKPLVEHIFQSYYEFMNMACAAKYGDDGVIKRTKLEDFLGQSR
jgi:hypothetical protein